MSWRLQREDGLMCMGYQQIVRAEAESSSQVELCFNGKALAGQGITRDSASAGVCVRWIS